MLAEPPQNSVQHRLYAPSLTQPPTTCRVFCGRIVDEPTAGLDPEERMRFRSLLSELAGKRMVILSTHIVSDIEACATEIAIMDQGQLITKKKPEDLLCAIEGKVWEWIIPSENLTDVKQRFLITSIVYGSEGVQVRGINDAFPQKNAREVTPRLEDAYLYHISLRKEERQ